MIAVEARSGRYEIHCRWGALDDLGTLMRDTGLRSMAFVISDQSVAERYGKRTLASIEAAGFEAALHSFPSGEASKNRWANVDLLTASDEVKFVLCDAEDYAWAVEILNRYKLADRCPVLFSPVHNTLNPTRLAEWILRDHLPVRMQIQLHKYLWGVAPGR